MKIGFSFLALLSLISVSAAAETYKVSATAQIGSAQKIYQAVGTNAYAQVSNLAPSTITFVGTGPFAAINKTVTKTDTDVLGIKPRGHSKASLTRDASGKVFLNIDMLINDTIDGVAVYLPVQYSMEMQFTKGSWDQYNSGYEVELKVTPAGQAVANNASTTALRNALASLKAQFEPNLRGTGFTLGEIKLDYLTSNGQSVVRASRDRLEINSAPVSFALGFNISN